MSHPADSTTLLLLLGAPGAGKGTQGRELARRTGALHLSAGDLLRAEIAAGSELGAIAKVAIGRGELVPNMLTVAMIADRLARPDVGGRVVLDGFPRNIAQAEALDRLTDTLPYRLAPLLLVVDRARLERRLTGRSTCPACGAIYHFEFHPSRVAGLCDEDGATLAVRPDDQPAVIAARLRHQLGLLDALVDFYAADRRLISVDGEGTIDEVARRMLRASRRAFQIVSD